MYNKYSEYLKEKYGEKVYKIPVNLPITCPNRDGTNGIGGCIFCGDDGAGHECSRSMNLEELKKEVQSTKEYIGSRYKAKKFIMYFQNYSNTYLPINELEEYILEVIDFDVVEIAISTRPDCINEKYMDLFLNISQKYNLDFTIELGLQTVNYKTLNKINRGHTLGEFINAVNIIKKYNFKICTHLILNFPWDDIDDVIENSKFVSSLDIDFIKLHSLYIVKDTKMAEMYLNNEFELISKDEYEERVILFLRYLKSDIYMQRIIGRAPKDITLFENWNTSWWKIRDEIEESMINNNYNQGDMCNYLNGKSLKKFD